MINEPYSISNLPKWKELDRTRKIISATLESERVIIADLIESKLNIEDIETGEMSHQFIMAITFQAIADLTKDIFDK